MPKRSGMRAPASAPGAGKERGIAFGGGGEWFTAWTLAYLTAAKKHGVDFARADLTVGTSAGSLAGAFLTSARLWRGMTEIDVMAKHPGLLARLVKTSTGSASQTRASEVLAGATSTDPATIREIGRAAMAARNEPPDAYTRSLRLMLGRMTWPSPAHHVTCVDCFTGEVIVIDHTSGVPIATACAASSSLPGVNGPTWVKDRLCMDGGISTSSTHGDQLTGVTRAVIFTMMSLTPAEAKQIGASTFGFAERINPGTAEREAAALTKAGTTVILVAANPPHGTDFMDPTQLLHAVEDGADRAIRQIDDLAALWHDD